jgi:hypothetical protein
MLCRGAGSRRRNSTSKISEGVMGAALALLLAVWSAITRTSLTLR